MARYSDTLRNQNGAAVAGALVAVTDYYGNAVALTNDDGSNLANPFTTDTYGQVVFNVATAGFYTLTYRYGGREALVENMVAVGVPAVDPALATLALPTGAGFIGAQDSAGGSLWSTVQDFINYLRTSAGSAILGFLQSGTGAVARTTQSKLREIVSVKDFGAKGDGSTNDTDSIQAAFNSGARKVTFPAGEYACGALTLPDWLEIEGEAYQPTIGGSGRAVELRFSLTSGAALTCGFNPVIRNIFFQNTGGSYNSGTQTLSGTTAPAIVLTENAVIEECSFSLWHKCVQTGANTFYLRTSKLHFNRCTYGYYAPSVSPYDMHIDKPHSVLTETFLAGAGSAYPRNVKVFGGSVEGYSRVAEHFLDLTFFGTYFETEAPRVDVIAIEGTNGCSIGLYGCLIYANQTNRFINLSGYTDVSLVSSGNVIAGAAPATSFYAYLPNTGSVVMGGDRFEGGHPNDYLYIDSIAAGQRFNISMPMLPSGNTFAGYSGMQLINRRGLTMAALTAAPASPVLGMMVLADNATWDPLSRAGSAPYYVMWNGSAWQSLDGGA